MAAIAAQGMLHAVHNLTHHVHPANPVAQTISEVSIAATHSCSNTAQSSEHAPESPSDEPQQPDDQDCKLCLALHTLTLVLPEQPTLPVTLASFEVRAPRYQTHVYPSIALWEHPARGPPTGC
tara:strand:- start:147374 stop:147742 length:369 start_codon:yes stop_codon:yes gene_type:complete